MSARLHGTVAALIAIGLSLAACSRSDVPASQRAAARAPEPPPASSSQPTPPAVPPASSDASSSTSPSPQSSSSPQDVKTGETASGNDAPMKSMTKEEEAKTMPQPGQANDHSTLAQDPKQPK